MADYIPQGRSSYFQVKDPAAFHALCTKYDWEAISNDAHPELVGFLCNGEEAFPMSIYNPATEEDDAVDCFADLAVVLADGWAAECREIGSEKRRYLFGMTTIVRWDGRLYQLNLNEAVAGARTALGAFQITDPEY